MALSILDGTQTATTLSTILSSGQHITAHTVVSLGTQAITDMRSAVSGSVVSIPSLPAISGTVTANGGNFAGEQYGSLPTSIVAVAGWDSVNAELHPVPVYLAGDDVNGYAVGIKGNISGTVTVGNAVTIGSLPAIGVFVVEAVQDGNGNTFGNDRDFPVTGTVAIGAGVAQIGSVTASLAISSTAITSGSFSSLTSATLVPANTARKMATVYNLGAGQLFVNAGASATTLGGGFMVALSSGDFYECDYTTTTLSAIFATAGTASWVSH